MTSITDLYMPRPCAKCPFSCSTTKGSLGQSMINHLYADAFSCHLTKNDKQPRQCAGHMLMRDTNNSFVMTATRLGIELNLDGKDLVFKTENDCINHHKYGYRYDEDKGL